MLDSVQAAPLSERAFLQTPARRAVEWRVRTVLRQFLREAMPIFLLMCVVGALLSYWDWLDWLAQGAGPLISWTGLPPETTPGLVFSIVRKDGLLVLNQGQGALLSTLSTGQVLILVYLASTFTACLVTLWTVYRELGATVALHTAGRQVVTSLASTTVLVLLYRLLMG